MGIEANAESRFWIDDYNDEKSKIQVINFFLGLIYSLPIKNSEFLAQKLWQVLACINDNIKQNNLRKEIIFKLTNIIKLESIYLQCNNLNKLFRFLNLHPSFQAIIKENQIVIEALELEILKPGSAALRIDEDNKIVFGAAPEFIKPFLQAGEKIPEFIVLSKNTFKDGINFAEIEFSIYNNFFLQNGRKVKVICTEKQEIQLRIVLSVTLFGPDYDGLLHNEKDQIRIIEINKLKKFRDLLIPRDKEGNIIPLDSYIEFIHFIDKKAKITLRNNKNIFIYTSDKNPDLFFILNEKNEVIGDIDLSCINKNEFTFPVQRTPLSRDELGIFVLDSGDGFTPDRHTSSFLLWLEGSPLLVDPMAYSDLYLKRKGIDKAEIKDIFLSHNHGDHDQGVYNYLISGNKIRIIGSWIVIQQTIMKVAAAIDKSFDELKEMIDFIELPVGKEIPLEGYDNITVELEYGLHPIPSNMIKFRYKDEAGNTIKTLGYSGDTFFDPEKYQIWLDNNMFNEITIDRLQNFFIDADIIVHEAGGGSLHTDMEKLAKHYKGKDIYWVHTKETRSKYGKKVLEAGDQITIIKEKSQKKIDWYIQIFKKVPLFVHLAEEELMLLARMAVNKNEITLLSYYAGEILIKEGDLPNDNSFYIIAQGSLDVLQQGQHIATLGVGQQIGEMAIFGNNEGKRNATIRAFTGIKLLKINESAYRNFINKIIKAYSKYSTVRPILETSNSPFRGLNKNILDNIAARMEKEIFGEESEKKTRILIKKGEIQVRMLYLIIEGEAGVIVDEDKSIGFKVGKGSILGEMSMLDQRLPTATVITISKKLVAYTLKRESFLEIIEQYPSVKYILEGIAQKRKMINEEALKRYKNRCTN